ncbi:MAG: replicative DNA helicase [Lentisphaeria bacterium]|nr:replicative DNA helicase [Lentisphaeria bacterium]
MPESDDMREIPAGEELPSAPPESRKRTRKAAASGSSALPVFASPATERSVIAALITDPTCVATVGSILGGLSKTPSGDHKKHSNDPNEIRRDSFHAMASMIFYDPKYALLYETILEMNARSIGVDLLSLTDFLERENRLETIGGQDFLLELMSSIASTANIESWCGTLRDFAMLREMLRACSGAVDMCKNSRGDVKVLLDSVESEIFKVRNQFVQPDIKPLSDLLETTFYDFMALIDKKKESGIPTGYPGLDRLIGGGLKPGEMFVLAARPSIGKTAIALNIVRNIIMRENPDGTRRHNVLFFSLEMSGVSVAQRLLCTEAKVPLSDIMDGNIQGKDIQNLTTAASKMKACSLLVDETAGISVFELRAKARKVNDRKKLDLIVIDYLQLMKSGESVRIENRQVEVAAISGGLKKLAKDLQVPVLVLAQVNREAEKEQGGNKGGDALPKLNNLRESGAIEQDADLVVFLHRKRDESKDSNPEANRVGVDAKLIVEKNRNGKTGTVNLKFFPSLMEFRSIDHRYSDLDRSPSENPPRK